MRTLNDIKDIVGTDNPQVIIIIKEANSYEKRHDYINAITAYSIAIEVEQNFLSYKKRAYLYYKVGEYKKSINDFSWLIRRDNKNTKYLQNRASLYKKIELYSSCKNDLMRLIKIYTEINDHKSIEFIHDQLRVINSLIAESENLKIETKFEKDNIININPSSIQAQDITSSLSDSNYPIFENLPFEEALSMLRDDWSNIITIKDPCEELQIFAVNRNSKAIDFIINPCEAVLNNPYVISYLNNKNKFKSNSSIPEFDDDDRFKSNWW